MTLNLRERLEAARQRQKTAHAGPPQSCNLLVISDIHLGEFIKEQSRIEFLKRTGDIDRDLCDFLDYYASHRVDNKPWRLVINGDFFDHLTVTVKPSELAQERLSLELDEEERVYGLDMDEEKAVWKTERIFDRHQLLFAYLTDFIGRGNYLDMLYGNHDAEFYWPAAKVRYVELLADVYFGTEKVAGVSESDFKSRIRWHEWFLHEPGKFFIEHGNQYDDFSSFDFRLNPVLPFNPDCMAMPASHMAIRYFVNRLTLFQTHNKDNWNLWDFLTWMAGQGWKKAGFILKTYVLLTRRMLSYARQIQEFDRSEVEEVHCERVAQEAKQAQIAEHQLRAIDSVRGRPVHHSIGGTIQATALDQWALAILGLLSVLGVALAPGWPVKAVIVLLLLGLVFGRRRVTTFVRNRFLGGERGSLVPPKLDRAAEQIAKVLDVRYVVFGHTHRPAMRQVRSEPPVYYVNTGAWLVPKYRERHQGGCCSPLTYGVFLDRGTAEAHLMRWCQRNDCPEPYLAHLQPETDVPEHTEFRGPTTSEDDESTAQNPESPSEKPRVRRTTKGRLSLRKRRY